MNSAAFLLAINCSIGVSFAAAFLALSWKSGIALGRWCALGFLSASGVTVIEACANAIPSPHLTSTLSFSTLLMAITLIVGGLARHLERPGLAPLLLSWWVACSLFNSAYVFYLRRGSWEQGLGYQLPFAVVFGIGFVLLLPRARETLSYAALAAVFALCSVQFVVKGILSGLSGDGPSVKAYIHSAFAFYSQTAGCILSICLGISLVGVIVSDTMERSWKAFEQDALSGVLTRGAFMARAGAILAKSPVVVAVICDLDHFKSINDQFGHAAGDEVIFTFGRILCHLFNEAISGRLGGEEFCLLFSDMTPEAVSGRIIALQEVLQQTRYARVPLDRSVTASFGIAMRLPDEPLDALLHRADMALYSAKAAGRNRYSFADVAFASPAGSPA